jgi:flagella basal body P-ring formation protein FlgA
VTRQALAAREPLDTTKVTLKRIDYNQAPESYLRTLPFQALASRPLAAGQPLVLDLLQLPRIVQAGRAVRVLLAGQGFSISQQAIALASASIGQTVKVKTPSGRVLLGRVTGPDQVEINP